MEHIGTDTKGRKMFIDISASLAVVYHVRDTGWLLTDTTLWKGVKINQQSITQHDFHQYKRGCGAAFYDYLKSKNNVNL